MVQVNSEEEIVPDKAERFTEEVEGSSHSPQRSQAMGEAQVLFEGENKMFGSTGNVEGGREGTQGLPTLWSLICWSLTFLNHSSLMADF